jgi:hypothetical protein
MIIPPRPASFDVAGLATSDVKLMLLPMWADRPMMRPRMLLVHTNGAQGEGSIQSSYNWAIQSGKTKPHYQVDRNGKAARFLPSNRQGTAQYQANPFGIAIETADLGWPTPAKPGYGNDCGFTAAQAATLAAIIAYESILGGFPVEYPAAWNGEGVGCHTEPFGYPYWTNVAGKPCPGTRKKQEMRDVIMSHARSIVLAWTSDTPPSQETDDMPAFISNKTAGKYGAAPSPQGGCTIWELTGGRKRGLSFPEWVAYGQPYGVTCDDATLDAIPDWSPSSADIDLGSLASIIAAKMPVYQITGQAHPG